MDSDYYGPAANIMDTCLEDEFLDVNPFQGQMKLLNNLEEFNDSLQYMLCAILIAILLLLVLYLLMATLQYQN
jgi:hypothetical protein